MKLLIYRQISFALLSIFFFMAAPQLVNAAGIASYINSSLPNMDFSNQNLAAVQFINGTFSGSNFSGANLQKADFSNATLKNANFTNANLADAELSNVNLAGANLTGADLSHADLSNATLDGAIINGAKFGGAMLANVDMGKAIGTPAPAAVAAAATAATAEPEAPAALDAPVAQSRSTNTSMTADGAWAAQPMHHSSIGGVLLVIFGVLAGLAVAITPWIATIRCIMNKELDKVEKVLWAILSFFVPVGACIYLIVNEKSRKWRIWGISVLVLLALLIVLIIFAIVFGASTMSHDEFTAILKESATKAAKKGE